MGASTSSTLEIEKAERTNSDHKPDVYDIADDTSYKKSKTQENSVVPSFTSKKSEVDVRILMPDVDSVSNPICEDDKSIARNCVGFPFLW